MGEVLDTTFEVLNTVVEVLDMLDTTAEVLEKAAEVLCMVECVEEQKQPFGAVVGRACVLEFAATDVPSLGRVEGPIRSAGRAVYAGVKDNHTTALSRVAGHSFRMEPEQGHYVASQPPTAESAPRQFYFPTSADV